MNIYQQVRANLPDWTEGVCVGGVKYVNILNTHDTQLRDYILDFFEDYLRLVLPQINVSMN